MPTVTSVLYPLARKTGFNWMNQFDMAASNDYMFGSQPFVAPQY